MDKTNYQESFADVERKRGIEGVVDLWLHGVSNERNQALEYVVSHGVFSRKELQKAYNSVDCFFPVLYLKRYSFVKRLLQTAKLLHHLNDDFCGRLDITSRLRECAVKGYVMTDERLAEFSARLMSTEGISARSFEVVYGDTAVEVERGVFKTFNFYLDAPAAICLFHHDEPRAVASFFPEDETTLQIKQIQGAKNNRWVSCSLLSLERALQIYDATAERLGYSQIGIGNWYKKINDDL